MLTRVVLRARGAGQTVLLLDCEAIAREFPSVEIAPIDDVEVGEGVVHIDASSWYGAVHERRRLDAEARAVDARGPFTLRVEGEAPILTDVGFEALTRYQGFIRRRNAASRGPQFARALARIEAELRTQGDRLARALDTWQWLLRIEPDAGLPLQLAALLHAHLDDAPPHLRALLSDARALSFISLGAERVLLARGPADARRALTAAFGSLVPDRRAYVGHMRHTPGIDDAVYELMASGGLCEAACRSSGSRSAPRSSQLG